MAKALQLTTSEFTRQYCKKTDGYFHLIDGENGECMFLKQKRCQIYEGRPTQCRTWPFWPEVMDAKTWNQDVAKFCPGVGKGHLWTAQEIQQEIDAQLASENSEP